MTNFSYYSDEEYSCQWLINKFCQVKDISIVVSPYIASIGVGNVAIELNPLVKTKSDATLVASLTASVISDILEETQGDVIQFEVTAEYFSVSSTFREFFIPISFKRVKYCPVSVFMPKYDTDSAETGEEYFARMSENDNWGWKNLF